MSTTQTHPAVTTSIETEEDSYALSNIGVEFEFPIARRPSDVPVGGAQTSDSLRSSYGAYTDGDWAADEFGPNDGYMGSDHTGAEITSHILDLHSGEPERWYRTTIDYAQDAGYTFAATGYGETNFGLHLHLSEFDEHETLTDIVDNEWARVFFCSSVNVNSLDPWRHGGAINWGNPGHEARSSRFNDTPSPQYEFRLPEPGLPQHFKLMVDFFRIWAVESPEAARDFARELVHDRDQRLTPVVQYQMLSERDDNWPTEDAFDGGRTDPSAARWFHDLMS